MLIKKLVNFQSMKSKKTTTIFDRRKGAGDEVVELLIGFLQDDTDLVFGNERT